MVIDIREIFDLLPHRYPFLLVDRVLELKRGEYIKAIKCVTINEPFFNGHFPEYPVMPGVLVVEALAQAGGIIIADAMDMDERKNSLVYFAGIEKVRFKRVVRPGDVLVLEGWVRRRKGPFCFMEGRATVEDDIVCTANLKACIVKR